jgi:hypothetical protein
MGHSHAHRPFVSRREFLRRSAIAGAAATAGPWFWRRLAYAADAPIRHVHLTHGADAGSAMTVSWMTPAPVSRPFVELAGGDGRRVEAVTAQYPGYPGFFHHAEVAELAAGTAHTYRIGHADETRTGEAGFRTAPSGRAAFTFTAFGDQGIDQGGQPPVQPSANTALAQSFEPALHLVVGDLAYANGNQAVWDDWFGMIEPMASSTAWMPCIGNHEIESQLDVAGTGDSWGAWGYDPYRNRFALPSNGHDELAGCFYGFRYASTAVVSIDNNDVNDEITHNVGYSGGRQRAWVERTLAAAAADPGIDFIVVLMHQCAFSSSTKHGSDEGVRRAWFELFSRYGVDLVLQGHDHIYERTHAMQGERVAGADLPYRTDAGTVYVVCGNGGAVQEPLQPAQPAWSAFRQALKVGTLRVQVEPTAADGMSRLILGEYWALDGSPIEEGIVLEKPAAGAAAPAPAAVAPATKNAAPRPEPLPAPPPAVTLPATGGPAGTALVGVGLGAGAAGLALRAWTREEARDVQRSSR